VTDNGADDDSIAQKMAIPKEAVRWFRLAFYDVERMRGSPLRITHDLIGITDEEGQSVLDMHRLWKLIGYKLGPGALDQLFHDVKGDTEAFKTGGLAAWLSRYAQSALRGKQLVAMNNLNADDPKQVATLLKLLLQEQRSQRQSEATSLNALEQHVSAMLAELPWTCGTAAKEVYRGTEIGTYDGLAAELRDDEVTLVAAGEQVRGLDEVKILEISPRGRGAPKDKPDKTQKT
jgi:hypothetical protein